MGFLITLGLVTVLGKIKCAKGYHSVRRGWKWASCRDCTWYMDLETGQEYKS